MMNLTQKKYSQTDKFIFSVCLLSAGVLVYVFSHFKTSSVKLNKNEVSQINYEMVKIQNTENLYSLDNREIEKNYKALPAKKTLAKSEVKKIADKNSKTVSATAAASAQKNLAQNQMAFQRQALAAAQRNKSQTMNTSTQTKNTPAEVDSFQYNNNTMIQSPNKTAEVTTPQEVQKKSYEQWKAEVFAAQSKEAIIKLVSALKKGEITHEEYQKLVTEMVATKDDKMVGLALYALRSVPSYSSYVQLIKLQSQVNSSYSSYIEESLISYNQNAHLGVLKQSLASQDKQVVIKTLEIIKTGVSSVKSGEVSALIDSRYRRDTATAQFSLAQYLSFLPTLKSLAASLDQEIVALASQNISLIDDPQYIAAN